MAEGERADERERDGEATVGDTLARTLSTFLALHWDDDDDNDSNHDHTFGDTEPPPPRAWLREAQTAAAVVVAAAVRARATPIDIDIDTHAAFPTAILVTGGRFIAE